MDEQERQFWRAIEADPADVTVRLAFADHLDEQGDPRGPGMRVVGQGRYTVDGHAESEGGTTWFNFHTAASHNGLPNNWFARLSNHVSRFGKSDSPENAHQWRDYPSLADAESDACLAFAKLSEVEQAELLLNLEPAGVT